VESADWVSDGVCVCKSLIFSLVMCELMGNAGSDCNGLRTTGVAEVFV
jgi:hypothetical protein